MKYGVMVMATDYSMAIAEVARETEDRGFESLFLPEHTHIPVNRVSPWPGGAALPKSYWHTIDQFVGLATAAAVTKTLRLCTGICLLPQHNPLTLAKAVATLDMVSGGRAELGIGAGWNAEEMANHGTVFADRFRIMVERARAIKAIWTQEEPAFHGDFVDFDPVWSYPKPVQKPHPPMLVGGSGSVHNLRRVVAFGDGWLPIARSPEAITDGITALRGVAADAGRSMDTISVNVFAAAPDHDAVSRYADAGATRVIFALPTAGRDDTLAALDKAAAVIG